MIVIDGSFGEGGGQVLRTSLALALVTGKPFRIEKIRAGRKNPGLLRQHLTAVKAAAQIGQAEVSGDGIGSQQLAFAPGKVAPGNYAFAVGTAGSATLVLQTVLPALMMASGNSSLVLEGGTHNPFAPPFDFLAKVFLPLVNRMGPQVSAKLERPGFYPAGGGKFSIEIEPAPSLNRIDLLERGEIRVRNARAMIASLPRKIAERELALVKEKMSWNPEWLRVEAVDNSLGPGNIVMIELESEHVTELFTGFGERGVPAEGVADQAVQAARRYLAADVAVGEYLADQLMIPMALAGGGSYTTLPLSRHATTNIEVIRKFLDVGIEVETITNRSLKVTIRS
ncbi:MAG TPA: RNA 3'-terminal phosphate cyclase [Blastocatellia bacterium]|nr:RNA 3'-terminal phosphate cyclase [Blastocatellia bacterium]